MKGMERGHVKEGDEFEDMWRSGKKVAGSKKTKGGLFFRRRRRIGKKGEIWKKETGNAWLKALCFFL